MWGWWDDGLLWQGRTSFLLIGLNIRGGRGEERWTFLQTRHASRGTRLYSRASSVSLRGGEEVCVCVCAAAEAAPREVAVAAEEGVAAAEDINHLQRHDRRSPRWKGGQRR